MHLNKKILNYVSVGLPDVPPPPPLQFPPPKITKKEINPLTEENSKCMGKKIIKRINKIAINRSKKNQNFCFSFSN